MSTKLSEIVLTRYLYNKAQVIESLQEAVDKKDYESAVYWAYEIYYSGFEDEIIQYLIILFENRYKHHVKLRSYIRKKYNENILAKDPTFVATILKNMQMKKYEKPETEKPRCIIVKTVQIEKFKTVEPRQYNWKQIQTVCEKQVTPIKNIKKTEETKLLEIFRNKWLFYASRSPIWKTRILEYDGKIDGRKKTVEFKNDDDLEAFHDKYDYEPDEQPLKIQKGCMGIHN
jgi:hypothetical protein